jgi:hypothetical protein
VEFVGVCSWPVLKVLLINCELQMKMCPIAHQKVFGRPEFSVNIPWNWWQNCNLTSLSRSLRECTVAVCMSEVSGQYAGCAIHSCQTCLMLERAHMQIPWTAANGCQQLGYVLRCVNCGWLTGWLFAHDRAFFTPLPYQSVDCIWRWCILLIQFTAKSILSLRNEHCPNKHFHSTHTFSNSPTPHVN